MRRVLVIHYHFLPVHNVAVKQLVGYARHLPAFGWHPIVLTRDWQELRGADAPWGLSWEPDIEKDAGLRIHRVPAPARLPLRRPRHDDPWPLRKALSLAHMLFGHYPDEFIAWAQPALEAALALARTDRIDAILSYCPPETNHVLGSRLARILDVPWIPFFGDLYGFFLAPLSSLSPGTLIRKASHHRWLAPAAVCAAVSPYMVEYLTRTYRKPAELVLVGFEPSEFADAPGPPARARERFIVSHVGSLYPGNQKPEIFFDGLDRFLLEHGQVQQRLQVRFVGSKCEPYLRALVGGRPCARVCAILPKVDSTTAVSLVRGSDALLVFNCTAFRDRHGTMSYPSKIFEGFGARRPVLAIPADGDWVDALLARTNAGTSASDADAVAGVLWDWFSSWSRDAEVPYHGRPEEIAAFSRRRQAERLSALLSSVIRH